MKKVLILSHWYFPNAFIPSYRMAHLAKYLPLYGWEPKVVCSDWTRDNCDMFDPELLSEDIEKTILFKIPLRSRLTDFNIPFLNDVIFGLRYPTLLFRSALCKYIPRYYFTRSIQYYYGATAFLKEYLKTEKVDCILGTFPNPAPFKIANEMNKRFHIPWIADFRDTYDYCWFFVKTEKEREAHIRQEIQEIKSCSAILTISEALKNYLKQRHPQPIHILYNGYDPEEYKKIPPRDTGLFSIVYTGSIYFPYRDPTPLFSAVSNLIRKNAIPPETISIDFFGRKNDDLNRLSLIHPNVRECIRIHGVVGHGDAIAYQKGAQILLHLTLGEEKGILTGKLFEYLAAKRPILAIPSDKDCVEQMLRQTRAGIVCSDQDAIEKQLMHWYQEWKQNGSVPYRGIEDEIVRYSRREQAKQLADILDECTSEEKRDASHPAGIKLTLPALTIGIDK